MSKYRLTIPDPYYGGRPQPFVFDSIDNAIAGVRDYIVNTGFGASEVGSRFDVYEDDAVEPIGAIAYNGRWIPRVPYSLD